MITEKHTVVENNKRETMSQNVNVFYARFLCHITLIKIAFFYIYIALGSSWGLRTTQDTSLLWAC